MGFFDLRTILKTLLIFTKRQLLKLFMILKVTILFILTLITFLFGVYIILLIPFVEEFLIGFMVFIFLFSPVFAGGIVLYNLCIYLKTEWNKSVKESQCL